MPLPQLAPTTVGQSQSPGRWMLEVDTNSSFTAPAWIPVFGIQSFKPAVNSTTVDNSDFDTGIWQSQATTGLAWANDLTVEHKTYAGAEDAGQAFIRGKAIPTGTSAQPQIIHVRWYDRFGAAEAYEGFCSPTWVNQGGTTKDTEKIQVVMNGQGALYGVGQTVPGGGSPISNPVATNSVPVVTSVLPSGVAVGGLITITGTNFSDVTGAAGVKVGATNVTAYNIVSNTKIVAVMPAGSAGATTVTVTNPTGASNALAYTRGA